jgi:hypothetical protein
MYAVVRRAVVVVLHVAGLDAAAAADADREVERVAELHAGGGADVADGDLGAVAPTLWVGLEAAEDGLHLRGVSSL